MANEVDTSRLLGVDTISGTVIKAWNDAVQSATQYGPALLLALALAAAVHAGVLGDLARPVRRSQARRTA